MTRYIPAVKVFEGRDEWCIRDIERDAYAFFDTPATDANGRKYMEEMINAALSLPRYVWHKQAKPAGYWVIVDKTQEKEKPMTLRERAMKEKADRDAETAAKQAKHRAEVTANMKKDAQEIVKERLDADIAQEDIEVVFKHRTHGAVAIFAIEDICFEFFWDDGDRELIVPGCWESGIKNLYDLGEYLESTKGMKP